MAERHDRAGVAWAGLAGTAWGVGLSRFLAESLFISVLYRSPWAVLAVAVICGAGAALAYRLLGFSPTALLPLAVPTLYSAGLARGPLAGAVLLFGSVLMALGMACSRLRQLGTPFFLALLVFGLYLRTLLPSVGKADTLEFQVVVPLLRIAHPTGYPLYILATHPFSWLPIGSVALRVNLASAVYATAAVLVLYSLIVRLTDSHWAALLASLSFGVSGVLWSQAIVAEVYALHNLLVALALLLLVGRRGDVRRWPSVWLLLGASLSNHLTTALVLPAAVLCLVWERPRMPLRTWATMFAFFALGLSLYLYIPLRWPMVNNGEHMSMEQFVNHVTAQQFQGALQWDGWRDPVRWSIVGRMLTAPYGWPGLVLAGAGIIGWVIRQRGPFAITGVTFAAFVLYGLNYHVPDISVFLIPASLVIALWMGAGIASLVERVGRLRYQAWGRAAVLTLASLLPLALIWVNLPVVDQSQEDTSERWGRYVLGLPLEPQSVVLADVERFAPLHYLTDVQQIRPDLDVVILGEESLYRSELDSRLAAGQTVYLARYLSHLEQYSLRSVGPLALVSQTPTSPPSSPHVSVDVVFGQSVRLLGYDMFGADSLPEEPLRLTLHWQALGPISGDYVVRLRLVDGAGSIRWLSEGSRPVSGLYPTNAWRPGEVVTDYYEIALPPHLWDGEYRVEVAVFLPFSDEGLVSAEGLQWVSLTSFSVGMGELPPLANRTLVSMGQNLWLTGYEVPGEVMTGGTAGLTLGWRRDAEGQHALLHLAWVGAGGQVISAEQNMWLEHPSVRAFHTRSLLSVPDHAGDYTLVAGLRDEETGQALPAQCDWLRRPREWCPLAAIVVSPLQAGLASFDGKVLLTSAEVGAEQVGPGSIVPVVLHWRALADLENDYTVTVQLLGPDGRLHGQVDAWPVEGTLPTSQWDVGREIDDRYSVAVDAAAPAGQYQIVVGLYLLETMERLPVVDDAGRPTSDHIVIGQLELISP